jgi:hypothetical protein
LAAAKAETEKAKIEIHSISINFRDRADRFKQSVR